MRLASPDDLQTVTTLTAAAYRPYTELFGSPPIPVTEDYRPRIERGEVWLRDIGGKIAGLISGNGRRPNEYRPGWTLVDMTKVIDAA